VKKKTDILRKFGARLREARRATGLSQEAFADLCGLDRTYISGIERGQRNVALRNIEVIAAALGLTVSELTKGI
jgi:transcriptional regulator with XRE-family HTH domain